MTHKPSTAERIDDAIGQVLRGVPAGAAAATAGLTQGDRAIVELAGRLHSALAVPAVGPRFEAALGERLTGAAQARDAVGWALGHPGRLIVTGAVGSAVGVGVTAYAVWRSSRRASSAPHRFLHR